MTTSSLRYRSLVVGGTALLALALVLASCDQWVSDPPKSSDAFTEPRNTDDLERFIAGGYWIQGGDGGFDGMHGNQGLYPAFVADLGNFVGLEVGSASDDAQAWYNRDFSDNTFGWYEDWWDSGYAMILQANQIIRFIDRNGAFDDEQGDDWTTRIRGEAHFLRAYAHFTLQRLFGPPYGPGTLDREAILVREVVPSTAFDNPGLSTVEDVYNAITGDLETAIDLLPEARSATAGPASYYDGRHRADASVAHFLAAQVYFQMGDLDQALEHANAVINDGRYTLSEDPIEAWNNEERGDYGQEVVWQYAVAGPQSGWKPPVMSRLLGYVDNFGNWDFNDSYNTAQQLRLSDHFLALAGWDDYDEATSDKRFRQLYVGFSDNGADPSVAANVDAWPNQLLQDPRSSYQPLYDSDTLVWANKWYRSGCGEGESGLLPCETSRVSALPLMRVAEMYLTRAYIRAQNNDLPGAVNDLDAIRARADVPAYSGPMTQEAVLQAIEVERMKELAFENDRLHYLTALNQDIPAGDRPDGSTLAWENTWVPIPESEVESNNNISRRQR